MTTLHPDLLALAKDRPYQVDAWQAVFDAWENGTKRALVAMATGTGKTVIFLGVIRQILAQEPDARILILAHVRELIMQPVERARQFFPDIYAKMGVVMAEKDACNAQIIVATMQTASIPERMNAMLNYGTFTHIIVDECHFSVSDSYLSILDRFPEAKVLGLTATPKRTDRISLKKAGFEKCVYRLPITKAIDIGALVPFIGQGFILNQEIEFKDTDNFDNMGDLLSADNILEFVYGKWMEFCAGRQTIGFCASVAQAYASAEYFRVQGARAEAVDGTTPTDERDAIRKRFESGATQVVFNVFVWATGFDMPAASAALMIAPTKSDLTYTQKVGRILRTAPDKTNAIVIDFAPKAHRDMIMLGDLLDGITKKEKKAVEKAEKNGLLFGFKVSKEGIGEIDPAEVQMIVLDYLGRNRLAWTFDGGLGTVGLNDEYTLAMLLPDHARVEKAQALARERPLKPREQALLDHLASARLYLIQQVKREILDSETGKPKKVNAGTLRSLVCALPDVQAVQSRAEDVAGEYIGDSDILARKDKGWRKEAVSAGQALFLRRLGGDPTGLTRGQAAQRITHLLAKNEVNRAEQARQAEILRG